ADRSYKDLVREMHSKTFGNRWIAAYELSKLISSSNIPTEDIPWLVGNLSELYHSAQDNRTRDFIVVALGALDSELILPTLAKALDGPDENVRFHAVVGLSRSELGVRLNQEKMFKLLEGSDEGISQSVIFALAMHKIPSAEEKIVNLLSSKSISLRYASATALIAYQNAAARETLIEILKLNSRPAPDAAFDESKVVGLKMNILKALTRYQWNVLNSEIEALLSSEQNLTIVAQIRETLNELKKR